MTMPTGVSPKERLRFEYDGHVCNFEVPTWYKGQAELLVVPPANWPQGDSVIEPWTVDSNQG